MVLDFDLKGFVEDMRACKPPYKCPFNECGKVYKVSVSCKNQNMSIKNESIKGTLPRF